MATLTLTAAEISQIRELVDTRATIGTLPDAVFAREVTLGTATDWAWAQARKNRTDTAGLANSFATFLSALSADETTFFRRAVSFYTAGLVIKSYRQLVSEQAVSIEQRYSDTEVDTQFAFLLQEAVKAIHDLRNSAAEGVYPSAQSRYTLFAVTAR